MPLNSGLAGDVTVYVISDLGQCIGKCELADPAYIEERTRIDEQLVGGFISANMHFNGELQDGVIKTIRYVVNDYETEYRIMSNIKANELIPDSGVDSVPFKFYGLLVLRRLGELEPNTYSQLDALNRDILFYLDVKQPGIISDVLSNGRACNKEITGFVEDSVLGVKEQLFSSYLLRILGSIVQQETCRKEALELLANYSSLSEKSDNPSIEQVHNHNNSLTDRIKTLRAGDSSQVLEGIIKQVNAEFKQVFALFKKSLL